MNANGRDAQERERARLQRERERAVKRGENPPPVEPIPSPPVKPVQPAPAAAPTQPEQRPPSTQHSPVQPQATYRPAHTGQPASASPKSPSARNRRRLVVFATAAVLILWFILSLWRPFAGEGSGTVAVTVPRGASVGEIGDLLVAKEVVPSAFFFGLRTRMSGKAQEFQAGNFKLRRGMSYGAAITSLASKPNSGTIRLTIPEGRSRYEIAQLAAESGLAGDYMAASALPGSIASKSAVAVNMKRLGAPSAVDSFEGALFPATYELAESATAETLVLQQLKAFQSTIADINMSYARNKNLTDFDVLTIASLVEREVQVPAERKLVAAVIYNRLKQGIPLGIDATSRFETRNWTNPLTNATLTKNTPYNTRLRRGLPPGPIGNPGLASIKAAARPARVPYLFYVANPCKPGTHSFSSTDAEFQRDVERYNSARARAGGKQPSGC